MRLEVKISPPLFHSLPVEITVELGCLFGRLLDVFRNLAGLYLLRVLLLHLLEHKSRRAPQTYSMIMQQEVSRHDIFISIDVLTEYSLAILCRSRSWSMTEYSECFAGYSFIIRSITSSLRRAVRPGKKTGHFTLTISTWPSHSLTTILMLNWLDKYGILLTQSALCLSDHILLTQIELFFMW